MNQTQKKIKRRIAAQQSQLSSSLVDVSFLDIACARRLRQLNRSSAISTAGSKSRGALAEFVIMIVISNKQPTTTTAIHIVQNWPVEEVGSIGQVLYLFSIVRCHSYILSSGLNVSAHLCGALPHVAVCNVLRRLLPLTARRGSLCVTLRSNSALCPCLTRSSSR